MYKITLPIEFVIGNEKIELKKVIEKDKKSKSEG